MTIASSYDIQQ